MRKIFLALASLIILSAMLVTHTSAKDEAIAQAELMRRTQEMFDAIVPGNQEPFKKLDKELGKLGF